MSAPLPPVVVVHGFLSTRATNLPVHLALRRRGFSTLDVDIPGLNTQDPRLSSEAVGEAVDRALAGRSGQAHLVGVSLGGLIALTHLRATGGPRIHRCVSMGAPLQGTRMGRLAEPFRRLVGHRRSTTTLGLMAADSELIRWLNDEPVPDTEVYTLYHPDDPMVPHPGATLPWATNVQAPVGRFPTAHHQLILAPANLRLLADLLERGRDAVPKDPRRGR